MAVSTLKTNPHLPRFERRHLYAVAIVITALNALIRPALKAVDDLGWQAAVLSGFGIGFIVPATLLFGLFFLLRPEQAPITIFDWTILYAGVAGLLLPSSTIAWLIMAGLALLAISRFHNPWIRSGLTIIVFAALREPVTSVLLKIFATPLLEFDAVVAAMMLNILTGQGQNWGNIVIGADGHQLLILTGCTSYSNLSQALLIWFALSRLTTPYIRNPHLLAGVAIIIGVFGVNCMRLALLSLGPDHYQYFHDDIGSVGFEGILYGLAIGLSLAGGWYENRR